MLVYSIAFCNTIPTIPLQLICSKDWWLVHVDRIFSSQTALSWKWHIYRICDLKHAFCIRRDIVLMKCTLCFMIKVCGQQTATTAPGVWPVWLYLLTQGSILSLGNPAKLLPPVRVICCTGWWKEPRVHISFRLECDSLHVHIQIHKHSHTHRQTLTHTNR